MPADRPFLRHIAARWSLLSFGLALAGCATDALEQAPAAPDKPWTPVTEVVEGTDFSVPPNPDVASLSAEVDPFLSEDGRRIDPEREYDLASLIDLAQTLNPETRFAWEAARQAALSVGEAEASFLPFISANVIGGWQKVVTPLPAIGGGTDYVDTDASGVLPVLALEWLVFDFGQREALLEVAKHTSYAANVDFNGTHQALILNVARAYHVFAAARANLAAAEAALSNSRWLSQAAQDLYRNGNGTVVDVAQARQQVAQAKLQLIATQDEVRDAYQDLLGAVGLSPTAKIKVADDKQRKLPPAADLPTEKIVEAALSRRPDVLSSYARVRASEAQIKAAEADFFPKVYLGAAAATTQTSLSVGPLPSLGSQANGAGVLVGVTLPLFDGGLREAQLVRAKSLAAAAKAGFRQTRNAAVREIVVTADQLRSALEAYQAAEELVDAATTAYDAASDAYRHGVGSFTAALIAEDGVLEARRARTDARAAAMIAAASLAFSLGQMTSSDAADVLR